MNSKESKQTVIGIFAICLPLILGLIIWPDIKIIFSSQSTTPSSQSTTPDDIFIYYQWDEEFFKIHISDYKEFEADAPEAKISITVNGDHYLLPIELLDGFMKKYPNAKLSVLDENNEVIPELSIHRVPGY